MNFKKKTFFLFGALILLIISIWFLPYHCNSTSCLVKNIQAKTVLLKNISINVTVANTSAERELGLSGRDGLKSSEGMLFVFDRSDLYGFWMKDMKFSIDIVWIENNKVVFIEKNVLPGTYPTVFYPKDKANIVLELPSGFCDAKQISVGDSFILNP
ncbi:MAG: DUF192 domain-containing protein [Minisyncoccia bacterium]